MFSSGPERRAHPRTPPVPQASSPASSGGVSPPGPIAGARTPAVPGPRGAAISTTSRRTCGRAARAPAGRPRWPTPRRLGSRRHSRLGNLRYAAVSASPQSRTPNQPGTSPRVEWATCPFRAATCRAEGGRRPHFFCVVFGMPHPLRSAGLVARRDRLVACATLPISEFGFISRRSSLPSHVRAPGVRG